MKRVLMSYLLILAAGFCSIAKGQNLTPIAHGQAGNEVPEWDAFAETRDTAHVGTERFQIWPESDDEWEVEDVYMRHQAIIEFELPDAETMTVLRSDNFVATLHNLISTNDDNLGENDSVELALYDMADVAENGEITVFDHDAVLKPQLSGWPVVREHVFGEQTEFDGIDVTTVVRRDLFGVGQGDETIGFILAPITEGDYFVEFDIATTSGTNGPYITLEITGLDGGLGDAGPDGSTDSDTDGDTESGADGDTDTDTEPKSTKNSHGGSSGCSTTVAGTLSPSMDLLRVLFSF